MFNIYLKEMKKFFSILALVGVFAACKPETIQTAFTVNGAKATVTVDVVDEDGTTQSGYSLAVTGASLTPTIAGNVITFEAAAGAVIPSQTLTLTVSNVPGYVQDFSSTFSIPEILAGGVADLHCRIVVFKDNDDDWAFTVVADGDPVVEMTKVNFLQNKHYDKYDHVYTHEDSDGDKVTINEWYLNDSEYILNAIVDYKFGFKAVSKDIKCDIEGFKSTVDAFAAAEEYEMTPIDAKYDFKVSAYGMWTAYQKFYTETQAYKVTAKNKKDNSVVDAGSFTLVHDYCSSVEHIELGMPEHVIGHASGHNLVGHDHTSGHVTPIYEHYEYAIYSHYSPGHGTDGHGKYNNAGGGIAYAE